MDGRHEDSGDVRIAREIARITYEPASEFYPAAGSIIVLYDDPGCDQDIVLMDLPIDFIKQGRVSSWRYVFQVLADIMVQDGHLPRSKDRDLALATQPLDKTSSEAPEAGRYWFSTLDESIPIFRRGPELKSRYKAVSTKMGTSTISNSKRSSQGQSSFWERLLVRDGYCLLSGQPHNRCTASHIIPYSRPDLYLELVHGTYLYTPQYGLLLRYDLHHAFDRLEWSIYCDDDRYIVHYFHADSAESQAFHGKEIDTALFRGPKTVWPSRVLLQFHYRQCCQAAFRGFDVGMSLNRQ